MTVPNQTLVQILTATIGDVNKLPYDQAWKVPVIEILQGAKSKLSFMGDQLESEQVHHIANFLKEQALLLNVDRQLLSYINSAAFRILHTLEEPKPTHISIKNSQVNGVPIPDINVTQIHDNTYNPETDRELDLIFRRKEQSAMLRELHPTMFQEWGKRSKMSQPTKEKPGEDTSEKKSSDLKLAKILEELNRQRSKMSQPPKEKSEEDISEKKSSDFKLEL